MQKQDPNAASNANPTSAKNIAKDRNKATAPHMASSSQAPAVEIIELDNNQVLEMGDLLEPGEFPHHDIEKDLRPTLETEPPLPSDPKRTPPFDTEPAKYKDPDEDPSNLDSDLSG